MVYSRSMSHPIGTAIPPAVVPGRRSLGLLGRTAIGVAAVAWSALRARTCRVSPGEERVFRTVNDAPGALHPVVWPIMQAGSLGAVVAAAAVQGRCDGRRAGVVVGLVGTAVWGGVKLVKPAVARGRPAAHLPAVYVRGAAQTGLGYPSGHAAVSLTLASLVACGPVSRGVGLAVAGVTGLGRMYVGAHLPLDVVGGFGIGLVVGELVSATTG